MTRFIPRFLAINIRIIIVVAFKRHRKIKKGKKRAFKRSWNGIITSSRWTCSSCTRTKATKKTWDAIKTEKNNRRVVTGYYRKRMCIASSCIYIYIYIHRNRAVVRVKSRLNYGVCKVSPRFERRFMNYVTGEFIGELLDANFCRDLTACKCSI